MSTNVYKKCGHGIVSYKYYSFKALRHIGAGRDDVPFHFVYADTQENDNKVNVNQIFH